MDITPNPLGAVVDVTDPALGIAVEAIADAFGRNKTVLMHLLQDLADTRKERAAAAARIVRPGVDPARDRILEDCEQESDAARDLLIGRLRDELGGPVTVPIVMPESACRKAGRALLAAADAAAARWRSNVARFPQQQERRAG